MKRCIAGIIALSVVIMLGICRSANAQDLKKLSLDDPSSIGLKIERDAAVKVEGRASLKITTAWPTTVCLGEVTGLNVDDARLVFKAKVKSNIEGDAFLEMWVEVGGRQYFSKGMDDPVTGKSDWKTIRTPFMLQKGQKTDKATLNIIVNGKGIIWIDDVVLSKEPLR